MKTIALLRRSAPAVVAALLLAACATPPIFPQAPGAGAPPPYRVVEEFDRHVDRDVVWGGMVIEVNNFERYTEIELLAFPLDAAQRPDPQARDEGRFIAILPGFADPATLPEGRFVTLVGRITGERTGQLRDAPYTWPEVAVDKLHLWPRDFRAPRNRFSIGVGVGVDL